MSGRDDNFIKAFLEGVEKSPPPLPEAVFVGLGKPMTTHDVIASLERELSNQRELNDALAAKVAEWKSRAEKAEAALEAMEEDDRHLSKGNSTCA